MNPVILHSKRLDLDGESQDNLERLYLGYFLAGLSTELSIKLALGDLGLDYSETGTYAQVQIQEHR